MLRTVRLLDPVGVEVGLHDQALQRAGFCSATQVLEIRTMKAFQCRNRLHKLRFSLTSGHKFDAVIDDFDCYTYTLPYSTLCEGRNAVGLAPCCLSETMRNFSMI